MYRIRMLNRIADVGLEAMKDGPFEFIDDGEAEGILVRSADMLASPIADGLLAVARAGAGVNNIPVDKMTEKGVVVFNTPGANANGVKELAIAGLLLSCRRIVEGAAWCQGLSGADVAAQVEKGKGQFVGPEIMGKTLGVVGLGAIGVMVANAALSLGMEVVGYDPYISVEAAWGLSSQVKRARTLEGLVADADFISIHVPYMDATKNFFDAKILAACKKGVRIVNLSRGGLVVTADLLSALESGQVERYVCDFPEPDLLGKDKVLLIPHLGASTPESEDNCAVMACRQLAAYLKTGSIVNSVNFPSCELDLEPGEYRLTIMNRNVPGMIGQITAILAGAGVNIKEMINKNKGDVAYNLIDTDTDMGEADLAKLKSIEGVMRVRKIVG